MSNDAVDAAKSQNNQDNSWATTSLGNYNSDIGKFNSNVNSTISAGNPYQSKQYLQNQNIMTSGAMHSADDAAQQQLRDTALRTGTNTAAVANEVGSNARAGQRDLTQYNAGRDTANEDKWLMQQDQLRGQQLAGAQSEAGVYGTQMGGSNSSLGSLVTAQDAQNENWTKLGTAAMAGAGTGLTTAFA